MASAEREKARQEKVKRILNNLKSKDDSRIITGLEALKVHGDETVILPLIAIWNEGVSDEVEKNIIAFLSDIKDSDSIEHKMEAITSDKFIKIRQPLLTTIWNGHLDYSDYLTDFVDLAIEGDFMIAMECLTIIENLHGPFEEEDIMGAEVALREYVKEMKINPIDEQKSILILEISRLVSGMPEI